MDIFITEKEENKTVGDILKARGVSSTLLRRLKRLPLGITLDGVHVTVRERAARSQLLRILDGDVSPSENIIPQKGELDIVYEDDGIIIINKPFGMAVHPSPGHFENTLANFVMGYFLDKGEKAVFRAVNRLDSGTGGLMCVAKNAYCAKMLGENLAEKKIKRVYEAVVCGRLAQDFGTIDKPIGKAEGHGIKRCVAEGGERAVTHFRVLERGRENTRVEIELETGRTHQIRVHFSHMGHPVWGDFMYGQEEDFKGHALFSKKIELCHPLTNEKLVFLRNAPEFFDSLVNPDKENL